MKFICVTKSAADEIAADRYLQSSEFAPGDALCTFLTGNNASLDINPHLSFVRSDDGVYIICHKHPSKDVLVIDLEQIRQSGELFIGFSNSEIITVFQKIIRFSIKWWKNLKRSSYEFNLPGSSKTIIFPFPVSSQTSFRIAVEREPDAKRFQTRQGNHLLVYKAGTSEGDGAKEIAGVTNFRKALAGLQNAMKEANLTPSDANPISGVSSLYVTELGDRPRELSPLMVYDDWLGYLTSNQKEFINADFDVPHRLEGPAGTGKSLCLRLRAITALRAAQSEGREHHAVYVVPGDEIRRQTAEAFELNDPDGFCRRDRSSSLQSLKIVTLQKLCADLLQTDISDTEFLDSDSMESKGTQLLYINEAVERFLNQELKTYERLISPQFSSFLKTTDAWKVSQLLQHEIGVVIKGRAQQSLDSYKSIPRPKYGLPLYTEADRVAVFNIYSSYQRQLESTSQFDIDDVVISTISQLDTPIWRRRRQRLGYDSIVIDEIHLFNMNELSLFHYITKDTHSLPISYAIDRSQAIGDNGWDEDLFNSTFSPSNLTGEQTSIKTIFRSAPDIVNLAFSVTSSGASLFTNFHDPLKSISSSFTAEEEQKCSTPVYWSCADDSNMISFTFQQAEKICADLGTGRGNILMVAFDEVIWRDLRSYGESHNKPIELLTKRGDFETVKRAQRSARFLISLPEYVGGLEFDGVILVGVDKGRVPPVGDLGNAESDAFLKYAAHNRLYVAITRARYRLEIIGNGASGPSEILSNAIHKNLLDRRQVS